jgi:DNA ligase 1
MTLLADVVSASKDVADTSSRSRKVAILAELLGRLAAREVPLAVGVLSGVPRQGRVGVGYSTVHGIERAPAGEASRSATSIARSLRSRGRLGADRRLGAGGSSASCWAARQRGRPTSSGGSSPGS